MRQSQHEIVVLKPTAVFLSFLASQLPGTKLPDLRLLQIDNTAYVLEKKSDRAVIDVIEKNFPIIFHHEICRWLGDSALNELKINFLDFLCCFKFELHNHVILMETALEKSHQLLLVKPRLALFNWIKAAVEGREELVDVIEKVELAHLEENATALVKNFSNLTEIKPFIKEYYQPLSRVAMSHMSDEPELWPVMGSFQTFSHYFSIEIHTQLIHLPH